MLVMGDNIAYEPYYVTYNTETGELSDLRPQPVAQIVTDNGATTNKYETLAEAITAAVDGNTITLLCDIDLGSSSLSLGAKVLTIDGDFTISSSRTPAAVIVEGSKDVTIKCGIAQTTTASAAHGIMAGFNSVYSGKLTLDGATMTAGGSKSNGGYAVGTYDVTSAFSLVITNSTIQSNVADPTTTYTTGANSSQAICV